MKKSALAALSFVLLTMASAFARDGYAVRYTTTYNRWDNTFSRHYSYRETEYVRCGYNTCYEGFSRSSNVYIEETIVESGSYRGYTRVTVYRDRKYKDRYVTYYTRPHSGHRIVVYREYYRPHRYYHRPYTHRHYTTVRYYELDKFTRDIILGMEFVELGASVMSACGDESDACMALGLASSISGSLISISASLEEQERTELQRAIEANNKNKEEAELEAIIE